VVKIFVSYRREDGAALAGRLRDRLVPAFGADNVFVDVDNLGLGERFDQKLEDALKAADVFMPVIGRRWLAILDERALLPKVDYVRWETLTALRRGIPVVPLSVDGANLPEPDQLPEDLRALPLHGGYAISHEHFDRDVAHLVMKLREKWPTSIPVVQTERKTTSWWPKALLAVLVGMLLLVLPPEVSKILFPTKKAEPAPVVVSIPATVSPPPNLARPAELSGVVRKAEQEAIAEVRAAERKKQEAALREEAVRTFDPAKFSPPAPPAPQPTATPAPLRRVYDRARDGVMRIVVAGNADDIVKLTRIGVRDQLSGAGATFEPAPANATHRLQLDASEGDAQSKTCGGWEVSRSITYSLIDTADSHVVATGQVTGGACYASGRARDELAYSAAQEALAKLTKALSSQIKN
jgi:hypothetical protein